MMPSKEETIAARVLQRETLPIYRQYIRSNLAPTRKLLDKRASVAILPSEGRFDPHVRPLVAHSHSLADLLSIPCKQFLQILSQVQVAYQCG